MTLGWAPMRVCCFCHMQCASPDVGGFQGGHRKVELLFGAVHALQKYPQRMWFVALCRLGPYGCQSVGVAIMPCALVFWGVCWLVALYCLVLRGRAGSCLQHVSHGTCCRSPGLSKHGDPMFLHFYPLSHNLARVRRGGGVWRFTTC